jgi:large subunit ribosomal protein L3
MKGLIGRKLGMTQRYLKDGTLAPVTVIEAGPCKVLALRTRDKDGYCAVQLGFGQRKAKNVSRAVKGHVKAAGLADTPPERIREIRLTEDPKYAIGDTLKADVFAADEMVDVVAVTKGHGFQGVVKRWGFHGGRASHGRGGLRRTGSIGMKAQPGRIYKGRKMPGHLGNERQTIQNLPVVEVRADEGILMIRGSVPGPNGGFVVVRGARKSKAAR